MPFSCLFVIILSIVAKHCATDMLEKSIRVHFLGEQNEPHAGLARRFADILLKEVETLQGKVDRSLQPILQLLVVSAGINSLSPDVHTKTQRAIDVLCEELPALKKRSKDVQAIAEAIAELKEQTEREEQRGGEAADDDREHRAAVARAKFLSVIIRLSESGNAECTRILHELQDKIGHSVEAMKKDLARAEEKRMERGQAKESSARDYIILMARLSGEKSKIALPHILSMCDHLGLDLLHLSAPHLAHLLGTGGMSDVLQLYQDARKMLQKYREAIEGKRTDDESRIMRSPAGLASLLAGKVPEGVSPSKEVLYAVTPFYCSLPVHKYSAWSVHVLHHWQWLQRQNL
mmetsp:Transcript_29644/g.76592  ORF Transcript_29644/g.76592 Transcript_29644/m.76592 type:complete len:348 (-) Transcript_29644:50-1093(-)